ncbi:ATP-dependent DNA helicase MPH1 [Hondaea fermentalgiana]|uniref:ATP-dependent DNA helicase MPH1 n=1 Tax=Hondaea fermentalgiana TaxID=2315210 RepID=A0A2R5GMH9_9STRA|nr:ATP-dependent DNA helicase MPH1 [Hondaea fermentalgiana]|eukprot:GBG29843.1 ATP-dependent DNA helicase MPH1 [Hondaea fermentalgiana]
MSADPFENPDLFAMLEQVESTHAQIKAKPKPNKSQSPALASRCKRNCVEGVEPQQTANRNPSEQKCVNLECYKHEKQLEQIFHQTRLRSSNANGSPEDSNTAKIVVCRHGNDSFDEFAGPAVQMPHDAEAIKTWVYPTSESYPKREYQFSIVRAALLRNTLVVLPTGLGKTFIAAVVMFNIMRWFPTGKVIFVAPTKPLVSQQVEACHKIVGIDESLTGRMMGNIAASKRKEHWKTKRLFYCTPQTAENDCKTGLVPMEEVVCVVIDEAHRATGNYAFTNLIKELRSKTRNFRILALSATPGNDKARVQEVVDNLHVANLEYKAEMDPDVKPYVFNKLIQIIDVKSSGGMQDVETKLYDLAKPVYLSIQASSCCPPMLRRAVHKISPEMIVTARSWLYQNGTTAPVPAIRRVTAELGALSTLLTGIKYLAVEGVAGMLFHFEQTLAKTNINAVFERIAKTDRFRSFLGDLRLRRDDPDCNPKVAKLLEILTAHFRRMEEASQQTSCIVFAHSRATVASLVAVIEAQTDLRVSPFVGQRSTTSAKEKSKMKMAKASAALADEIDDDDDDDDDIDAGENDENDDTGFLGNGGVENFGLPGQSRQSAATSKQGGKESVATKGQSQREQQAIINKFKAGALDILVATCIGEEGLDIGSVDLIVCFDSLKSPVRMVQRFGRAGRKRSGSVVLLVSHGKEKNDLTAGTERSNKIHRLLREKLGTLTLHRGSNPRMVPKGIVPQVEYKELEIGSFRASQVAGVTPKKRKSKGDDTEKSKKRIKNTWVELKTPLRPFSPRENKYYADFVQTSRKPAPDLFTFSLFNRRDKLILGSRRAAPSSSRSKAYERIKLYVDRRVWALSNEPCESPHPSVIDLDAAPNNAKEKETFDKLDRDASAKDQRNMGHDTTTTAETAEAAADVNLFDEEAFIGGDDYNDDDDVKVDKDDAAHMSCAPSRPPSMSTLPPKFNLDADSQEDFVVHELDNEQDRPAQALEISRKPLQADKDVALTTSKSRKTPKSSSTHQEVKEGIVSASSATSRESGHAENKEMENAEMYKEREHWKPKFSVGDCVTIKRRPGRGFKPGGTARVTRVNKREQTYNLKYILEARSEKGVAEDQLVKGIEVDHVLTESSVKSPAHPVAQSGLEDWACGSARPRQAKVGKSYAEASTSPSQSRSESTGCTGPDASAGSPSISIVGTSPAEISQSPSKQGIETNISRQSASTPRLAVAVAEASPVAKEGGKENSVKFAAPPNKLAHSSVPAPAIVVPNMLNENNVSGDPGVTDIDVLKQGSISIADDSDSDDVASLFEEDIAMPPVASDENEDGADEDEDEDGNLKGLIDDSSQRSASRSDSDAAHSPDIYRRSLMESPHGLTGFGRRRFNMPIIDAHLRELNSRAIAGVNLESKNARSSKMGQVSSSASSPSSTSTSESANSVVLGGGGKRLRHHKVMEDSSQSQDFGPTPIKGKALDSSSEETPEARNEGKKFRQRKVLADSSQSQDFGPTPTKLETAQMGRRKVLADSPQSIHLGPTPRESVPQAEHVQSTKNVVAESAAMKEMVVEPDADVQEVSTRKADLSMNIESEPVSVPPSACNERAVIENSDNVPSGGSSSASLLDANTSVEKSSSRGPAQLVWADAHAKRRDITAVCRQMRHGRQFDVKMVRDFSLQGADFVLGSRVGVCILSQRRLMQLASAPPASSSSSSSEDTFAEKFFRAYMQAQSWSRVQTVMTSSVDETVQLLQHMSTVEEREGFGLRALGLASEDISEAHMRVIKFIMLLPGANLAVARRLIAQNVGRTLQDVLETLKAKSVMEQVPGLSMQMAGLIVTSLLRRSK